MNRFSDYPSYVSGQGVFSENGGASGGVGIPFPAPGIPQRQQQRDEENPPSSNTNAPVSAFSGTGVVVGASQPVPNQGVNTNTYTIQQNIREVPSEAPSGPNPLTQKSKLVQEHNAKNSQAEEEQKQEEEEHQSSDATDSDDGEEAEDDVKEESQESQNSKNSKNEDDVLIDLS